jgi:hypothetical protein
MIQQVKYTNIQICMIWRRRRTPFCGAYKYSRGVYKYLQMYDSAVPGEGGGEGGREGEREERGRREGRDRHSLTEL